MPSFHFVEQLSQCKDLPPQQPPPSLHETQRRGQILSDQIQNEPVQGHQLHQLVRKTTNTRGLHQIHPPRIQVKQHTAGFLIRIRADEKAETTLGKVNPIVLRPIDLLLPRHQHHAQSLPSGGRLQTHLSPLLLNLPRHQILLRKRQKEIPKAKTIKRPLYTLQSRPLRHQKGKGRAVY